MAISSRRRPSPSTPSNPIPDDFLAEILRTLPVKTLCRFRYVCKSWSSLLSSPSFSSLHLHFTATEPTYLQVQDYKETTAYSLHHQDTQTTCSLDFPRPSPFLSSVIGVVHGVVCFAYFPLSPSQRIFGLWNPAIRKCIDTPFPSSYLELGGRSLYWRGLGFDSSNNDFKLVLLPYDSEGMRYCDVFSFREGVWRSKKPLPRHISARVFCGGKGCFFRGSIHWLTLIQGSPSLLLFDCELDEFTTMDFPEEANLGIRGAWARLVVYHGLLQVWSFRQCGARYVAWRMEEYGDATTWTKHEILPEDEIAVFKKYMSLKDNLFVFKESLFLMDIGNPIEPR